MAKVSQESLVEELRILYAIICRAWVEYLKRAGLEHHQYTLREHHYDSPREHHQDILREHHQEARGEHIEPAISRLSYWCHISEGVSWGNRIMLLGFSKAKKSK